MNNLTRRTVLLSSLAIPFVWRHHSLHARPNEVIRHASFGGDGMALSDVNSLSSHKQFKLVAVAEVDESRLAKMKAKFPDVVVYKDWRVLLDKEKNLDSANVSTPDHMHAPIGMSVLLRGLSLYGQKPLTHSIYESRQMALAAAKRPKQITQMGIQVHSSDVHRSVVKTIQSGAIGLVKEVHSWSGKMWGDKNPRPKKVDMIPGNIDWDLWLGVAEKRDFINGYYHPGEWRKRLDFGTGTFGDMGCHILDPVYGSLALKAPLDVESKGDAPNDDSWGLQAMVSFTFPGTQYTEKELKLTWYNGSRRPPEELKTLAGTKDWNDQGSVYIGSKGILYSPYSKPSSVRLNDGTEGTVLKEKANNHYHEYLNAIRGEGQASAPFSYSGPLTEFILLGCLATRFPNEKLKWEAESLKISGHEKANAFVRRSYRKGWEVEGL